MQKKSLEFDKFGIMITDIIIQCANITKTIIDLIKKNELIEQVYE
jgi:hypothetical protein